MNRLLLAALALPLIGCTPRYRLERWETVTVQPGDTLWELCDRVNPDAIDLREAVQRAVARNGGATIHPRQRVEIPVYGREND